MILGDVENDTIESYTDPEIVSIAHQEVMIVHIGLLPKFRNLTLRYDLFDLADDFRYY